jgi:murein DD-endopeptidase MepM/ murein hydrolase activator NlpD
MTRNPDPLFNLADALSEDIVAAPAETLMHDAENDPGGRAQLVNSFDRIAARAIAQSRRRRVAERLRTLLHAWPVSVGWTSAMAGVAGIFVVGIVGGMYFHEQSYVRTAATPPPVSEPASPAKVADRMGPQYAPAATSPMSYAEKRTLESQGDAQSNHAAAAPPAPAAAPSVATPAPPPAPAVAAGVADAPRRVRTVDVPATPATPSAPEESAFRARRAPLDRAQPRLDDRVAALVRAEEEKRLDPAPVSQASSLAPEPPRRAARAPALTAASRADSPPAFQWPLRGRVIAGFGADVGGQPNDGIDLAVPAGTDIRAAEEGVVLYTGNEIKGLGNLILLRHRDDFITAYAHAKSFAVKAGDSVRRGQVIAKSGQTGTVKAPQLHFEIRKESAPVDPARYLPPG